MSSKDYYNDGGKHSNCTECGRPVEFTDEESKFMESGNILYPDLMPWKKRKTKISEWKCHHCGTTGKNLYLLED